MTPEAGSAPAPAHAGGGLFATPATRATWRSDGSAVLRSTIPLGAHAGSMAQLFRAAAAASPERLLAAQREGGGWRTITYGLARGKVDGLAIQERRAPAVAALHAESPGPEVIHPALEPAADRPG